MTHPLQDPSAITDVPGIEAGHFTDPRRPTGCSVVLAREGAVAGVDVRGAAPGTRETDLLAPDHLVERVHAVLLCGGSAYGLDAAGGVMRWLEEHGIGLDVGAARVPIVPAAVLFDLLVGDARIRPDAAAGYAACEAASLQAPEEGCVGAGAGALVGKVFGHERAMKGGIGTASVTVGGVTVGALMACNALGDAVRGCGLRCGGRFATALRCSVAGGPLGNSPCGLKQASLSAPIALRSSAPQRRPQPRTAYPTLTSPINRSRPPALHPSIPPSLHPFSASLVRWFAGLLTDDSLLMG